MNDIEFEVQKALKQLDNYRSNHAPTDLCDDYMACAGGALIHQQDMIRRQHEAIKVLREALLGWWWSTDSKWQTDRAKQALKDTEEFQ